MSFYMVYKVTNILPIMIEVQQTYFNFPKNHKEVNS